MTRLSMTSQNASFGQDKMKIMHKPVSTNTHSSFQSESVKKEEVCIETKIYAVSKEIYLQSRTKRM